MSTALPLVDNVGKWYTQDITNLSSLQLIYIYCKTECAYDVIMSYDNDPLFMFQDNNYIKFLGENKKDIFVLLIFDNLSTIGSSTIDETKIELTILSGKAKLTLYEVEKILMLIALFLLLVINQKILGKTVLYNGKRYFYRSQLSKGIIFLS